MFVGRIAETGAVVTALQTGRPVVLVGPPGMGKSALATNAARRVTDDVATVRGIATLATVPFLLFRNHVDIDADDEPDDIADAVVSTAPAALILDDLQWADPASLDVVVRIASRTAVVATVRAGAPRSEDVLQRLDLAGFDRFDLQGLAEAEARELARASHPSVGDDALDAVVAAAQGNPLLLTELGTDGLSSPTLTAALLDRLDHLPSDAREAMHRLSVIGRPASAAELGPGADHLVSVGLAHGRGSRYEVHHDLLAEVVVDQLGPEADVLRRRVAALVGDYEAALLLGAAGDHDDARSHAMAAARAAPSPRDRLEGLLVALGNAPAEELDLELRREVVQLLNDFGRPEEALAHAALDRIDVPEVPRRHRGALVGLAAYSHWLLGDTRRFAELVEEALAHLRGTRCEEEVLVLAGSTIYATWVDLDGRSGLERAREAVALADEIGRGQAFARLRLAAVLSTAGLDGWADLYQEAIDLAERGGDQRAAHEAATSLVLAQWTRGDAHQAHKVAVRRLETTSRDQHPQRWYVHGASAAMLDMLLGVPADAIVGTWQPVLAEAPPFRTRPFMEAAVAVSLADLGRDGEADLILDGIVERAGAADQWRTVAHWIQAEVAWACGRTDDIGRAVAHIERLGIGDYPPAVMARLVAAHAAVQEGEGFSGAEPTALTPAWAATPVEWRALVAERDRSWDEAVRLYDEAARLYVDHDERSRVRCEWAAARALQLGGRSAVARLEAVEARAEQRGYRSLLKRIHPLLRRAGVARSAPTGRSTAGLTTREHEVMDLVGKGRTSSQIATELGISRDTVDDLAKSAMQRLGVSNRRAAVARLHAVAGEGRDRSEAADPVL